MTRTTLASPVNPTASLATAARRLRYLRRHPNPSSYHADSPAVRLGMAYAYEYALRVLIDEFGQQDSFHSLFYGPQNEDPDLNHSMLGN
jgi:hypothetical protein